MAFDIDKQIDALIKREGGFINHPADRGGPTKYGITQKTLTSWIGREATPAAVEAITLKTAHDIYYINYYVRANIDNLPELIRPIVFDMVVNSGSRGVKILQDTLVCHGYDCGKIDGKIGAKTAELASKAADDMGNELIRKLVRRRVIFYEGLVKADETQRPFLAGWINRAESFLPEQVLA